jgi:hypothetical protein
MLAYTMSKLLTQHANIERDEGTLDEFDGEAKRNRVVIAKVKCRFWWWREGGSRSTSKEYATPQRTINFTGGGILMQKGTNIEDGDHIENIEDPEGNVLVEGPFRVVAVEQQESHVEAALMRP